jgi:hypothetical protein
MRCALTLFLVAIPLVSAELHIDHVTLACARLDEARRSFTAATGISTEYGGPHANHATEMALASFPDGSYLELIGIQPKGDPAAIAAHVWGKSMREDAGPCAFAIHVADVAAEIRGFTARGVHAGAVERSGRTRPDGVALSWETADIGPGSRGSFFPFLIRDFTPRESRVYPSGKPTAPQIAGVGIVVIAAHDLLDGIAQYRKAFQLPEPKRQRDEAFGAELAWFEGTPIVLATPLARDNWLAQRLERYGDSPCAFVLQAGAMRAAHTTQWFGHPLEWYSDVPHGWRVGAWRP